NYWLNPQNGVSYSVAVRTPLSKINALDALTNTPVTAPGLAAPQLFGNLASATRTTSYAVVNHYNTQPVSDVYAAVDDRDLGGVASDVDRVVAKIGPSLPKGTHVVVRGQVASMRSSFVGLGFGVLFAVVLVYLLLVINFQSWLDPLVMVMALPGALCGIVWMLFVTQTTFNVPSLMGSIMALGVATANSVLLITFADDLRREGRSALEAALEAGSARLRPVCMAARAMSIGMPPLALGLGGGGERRPPRGPAAIAGGVLAAVLAMGIAPRVAQHHRLTVAAAGVGVSVPTVSVTTVMHDTTPSSVSLPGALTAVQTAAIYARTPGYVRRRLVDIGSRVRAGQLLADIDAPDLDQQVAQARGVVAQTRAAQELAQANLVRWRALAVDSAVTAQ